MSKHLDKENRAQKKNKRRNIYVNLNFRNGDTNMSRLAILMLYADYNFAKHPSEFVDFSHRRDSLKNVFLSPFVEYSNFIVPISTYT